MAKKNKTKKEKKRVKISQIFVGYTIAITVIIVVFMIAILMTTRKQKETTTDIIKCYELVPELSQLDKEQMYVFANPYKDIPDNDFFKLKRKVARIEKKLEQLKTTDNIVASSIYTSHIFTALGEYKDALDRIKQYNKSFFGTATGKFALINAFIEQLRLSNSFSKPPFKNYTDSILNSYDAYVKKQISFIQFANQVNRIFDETQKIPVKPGVLSVTKDRYLFLLKNIVSNLNDMASFSEVYGTPFSSGLFKILKDRIILAETYTFELIDDLKTVFLLRIKRLLIVVSILVLSFIIIVSLYFGFIFRRLSPVVNNIIEYINDIAKGKLDLREGYYESEEAYELNTALIKHVEDLRHKRDFVNKLIDENYDIELKKASNEDELGLSLEKLQQALKVKRNEEIKVREKEKMQKWLSDGLAFMNEKMRESIHSLDELFDKTLYGLLNFLNAPMGAFYYREEENGEIFYSLKIAYAYNKKRIPKKRFRLSEGFIGTVAAEKKKILFQPVPKDYIFYETAFGYGTPESLLIVPVISDNEVVGVLEIASMEKMSEFFVEFVEKFVTDYASIIAYVQINEQTKQLVEQLKEKTTNFDQKENEYKTQIDKLLNEKQQLERQIDELRYTCFEKDEIIKEKTAQISRLKLELDNKQVELQNAIERFETAERRYKTYIKNLEKQIITLNEELNKLRKQ